MNGAMPAITYPAIHVIDKHAKTIVKFLIVFFALVTTSNWILVDSFWTSFITEGLLHPKVPKIYLRCSIISDMQILLTSLCFCVDFNFCNAIFWFLFPSFLFLFGSCLVLWHQILLDTTYFFCNVDSVDLYHLRLF